MADISKIRVGGVDYDIKDQELTTEVSKKADSSSLAKVATSGSYNDLSNKPTIPSAVTESTVSGWGFTKNTGTYSKPSTGIPKTDLASAVQTSLGKADTALQSHQDISGKQDKLVSGTNIKTINGESILGSGDIEISGGGGKKVVSGNDMGNDITLKPNEIVLYTATIDNINVNGFEITPFNIESANPYNGYYDEYCIVFKTGIARPDGSSTFSLTLPSNVLWANGSIPEIEANTEYELSITRRAFNSTTYFFKAVLTPFKPVE